MLQTIRSKTHGIVAWVVIIVIGFVFAVWGIEGYLSSGSNKIAQVNGEVITLEELQRTYQQLLRQQQIMQAMQGGPAVDQALIEQQALSGLVSEKLLATIAHKQGFAVGKDQVDNLLRMLPQFQDNGVFSPEKFQSLINNMGYTPAQFRLAVQNDLMIGQVRSSIVDSAFVLPYELDRTIDLLEQTRDIHYLLIPAVNYIPETNITPDAIREFYDAHPADFMLPERVSIQYIRLNAENYKIPEPSQQMLQDFYQSQQAQFTEPEKRHAAHILLNTEKVGGDEQTVNALAEKLIQDLRQGADFAALAKEYSADPGSSEQGGDLGWFSRGVMVPQFEQAVFDAQTGELIGPIKTDFGVHIIKLIAVQPEVVKPFDTVKDEVRAAWEAQQRETQFAEEAGQLDTLTFENIDTLDMAAQALNMPIEKTELFSQGNSQVLGAMDTPAVVTAAFSDAVLLENRNSELIYLTPTDIVVLRKLDHKEPELQTLETVQANIKDRLALEQAGKKAHEQAQQWLTELKSGTPFDKIATKLPWKTETKTNRYNFAVPPAVLDAAFALPTPNDKTGVVANAFAAGPQDYALVIVNAVYPGKLNPEQADMMRTEYINGLTAFKGEMDYQLYVFDAEKQSDIEVVGAQQ